MSARYLRLGLQRFLAAVLVAAATFWGVGLPSRAEAAVASRIVVEGTHRVDAETIGAYLLIQPGKSYTAEDVDESLKALYDTGLFSDVQINQRGNTLVVTVVENSVINQVAFEGNKKYKDEQLAAAVQSQPRGVFSRSKVQGDVQRILELYRRTGRYEASVTPKVIDLQNGRVNLVFEIAEGPGTNVAGVNFIGNQAYGDSRLRNVIDTRQSGLLGFLVSNDRYDQDRLNADQEKLRRYYLDRGYADFQVVSAVADLDRERNTFFITFTVQEGPQYKFGAVAVDSSIPGVDTAELQRLVKTDEGDTFDSTKVSETTEALTLRLAGSGYPFAQVRPRLDRNPDALTVGVTYVIDEGTHSYVERIEVRGNNRTRDYVVRREFDLAEGDAFNRVLIERAERRLRNLGYFSDVRVTTEPGASPDRVVVVVTVVEQPTGALSFGAGYSTSDGVIGDISLSENNFLGRGYALKATVGGGTSTQNYEFSFTDPYFLGRRVSAGFDIYRREYDENSTRSYNYDTTGGGVNFGFPITENFTVETGYQFEHQTVDVPDFDQGQPLTECPDDVSIAICDAEGDTNVSSVLYSLVYDSLDNRRDPHDGIYAKFTQEFAGVGGDVTFLRTTASASYYRGLMADADVVGFLKVQGGHIVGIGENVRLIDEFFKGGETVRGFESSGFGPRDLLTDDALGGTVYLAGTAEVHFPLPLLPREVGFKGAFFLDAGTLFDTDVSDDDFPDGEIDVADNASLRSSVGASIIWASPLGLIRADFAYVLTSEDYDKKQVFRIGGGTQF